MYIRLTKSMLNTFDKNGFLLWLSQNPITVYYELKTPIITPIDNEIVLPNGVKDNISNNGMVEKKIKSIILNGKEE